MMKTLSYIVLRFIPPSKAVFRFAKVIKVTFPLVSVIGIFWFDSTVVTVVTVDNFLVCFTAITLKI